MSWLLILVVYHIHASTEMRKIPIESWELCEKAGRQAAKDLGARYTCIRVKQ